MFWNLLVVWSWSPKRENLHFSHCSHHVAEVTEDCSKLSDALACAPFLEFGTQGDSLAPRCVPRIGQPKTCRTSVLAIRLSRRNPETRKVRMVLHDAFIYDTPSVEEYLEFASLKDFLYDTQDIEKCLESVLLKERICCFFESQATEVLRTPLETSVGYRKRKVKAWERKLALSLPVLFKQLASSVTNASNIRRFLSNSSLFLACLRSSDCVANRSVSCWKWLSRRICLNIAVWFWTICVNLFWSLKSDEESFWYWTDDVK